MPRVKGLLFVSLFAVALSAQPVLAQDRSGDPSAGTTTNTDTAPNPQKSPSAKPRKHRSQARSGDQGSTDSSKPRRHRRQPSSDQPQPQ